MDAADHRGGGSLAANIAVAELALIGRVIAAWPSFTLTCSYELLMRQIPQSAAARASSQAQLHSMELGEQHTEKPQPEISAPLRSHDGEVAPRANGRAAAEAAPDGSRALQRQAWQWAAANRRPDGCLPSGSEVARQFRRSERWGRLVKNTGITGQFGTGA